MNRYKTMFAELERRDELAFIPFTVLGFPSAAKCLELIDSFIENGADALELGIPFSDPIADGPVIQRVSAESPVKSANLIPYPLAWIILLSDPSTLIS